MPELIYRPMVDRCQARFARLQALWNRIAVRLGAFLPDAPAGSGKTVIKLALASALACGLWLLRVLIKDHWHHVFLPWNLFLAWLPLGFAVVSLELGRRHGWRGWKPWAAAALWLLFFPNAPYVFTDLIHLSRQPDHRFWIDLIMILLFAWPAFLVGCLSLKLWHREVASRWGAVGGWLFVGVASGLAGVGVYIGRFLRWNSWDIVANPLELGFDLLGFIGHPPTHPAYRFAVLFGILCFVGYATLQSPPASEGARSRSRPG